MIDVKHRLCLYDGCYTHANYNISGQPADYCLKHKQVNMIIYPTKQCKEYNCTDLAIYGNDKPCHCIQHKVSDEYNLIEKQCNDCGLLEVLDDNNKCSACGKFSRYKKSKEIRIKKLLDYHNFNYISHDTIINSGECGKERPDFLFDCGTHYVIIEVDENQHCGSNYDNECEIVRMRNIGQQTEGLPVWFIRYNPDNYKTNVGYKRIQGDNYSKRHKKIIRMVDLLSTDISIRV